MEEKVKCKIILLESEKNCENESNIYIGTTRRRQKVIAIKKTESDEFLFWKKQHMLFLADLKIRSGDTFHSFGMKKPLKCIDANEEKVYWINDIGKTVSFPVRNNFLLRRVVACTNQIYGCANIPKTFLARYVSKKGAIENIFVDSVTEDDEQGNVNTRIVTKKENGKDYVVISLRKENLLRQEVVELFLKHLKNPTLKSFSNEVEISDWIDKHIK